ncbi:DNA-binding NarL/FixJ family response regulator [Pararhizobium capsulatum DSM 1112]|uniref:DNA-binding NarL/FixJ family response regulator n=1 Tax=Pararhizobium capsulatum DSM 1112 TaxID=1121113 RepID=A0ABU0BVB2_9HYPH|nr:response regulator transcription factor [Pararhizobium capsulatum]MDQ0322196.1 DNA-binding NarL/FixJ family response regulator [Pararhizobium capsulatum DSM 1112]
MLLSSNLDDEKQGDLNGSAKRQEAERVILILTNVASVSEPLIDAIGREFPWVHVEQVNQIDRACETFSHPVTLILIDVGFLKEAEASASRLKAAHPQALAAIIQPYDKFATTSLHDIAKSPLIRSVLPMDLRLDVWLSVLRLMLWGGEYLPFNSIADIAKERAFTAVDNSAGITELTTRELQILEMVCAGLQNKLIAAEFALSEHTVKIHLHNIMRKLGVHNRTEAAARFRSFKNGE